jgi:membrane-associated phospholipid phosphatase
MGKNVWKESLRVVILSSLILNAGFAVEVNEPLKKGGYFEAARTDIGKWPNRIFEDSKSTFLRMDNIAALMLVGGASIAMHNTDADKNIAENMDRHRTFKGFADEGLNIFGGPGIHFAATGIWYAISANRGDDFNKDRAWTMMTALMISNATTAALKGIVNNKAPNGSSFAWPSGHTASSFTVASVLDEFYGPEIGIPAYGFASVVAWRMMDAGDHWASDVVFGGVLGWVVGHTVAGKHKQLEVAGFQVMPLTASISGEPATGIILARLF